MHFNGTGCICDSVESTTHCTQVQHYTMTESKPLSDPTLRLTEVHDSQVPNGLNNVLGNNESSVLQSSSVPQEPARSGDVQDFGSTSDAHHQDRWATDTKNTARLQVVDETQKFTYVFFFTNIPTFRRQDTN